MQIIENQIFMRNKHTPVKTKSRKKNLPTIRACRALKYKF